MSDRRKHQAGRATQRTAKLRKDDFELLEMLAGAGASKVETLGAALKALSNLPPAQRVELLREVRDRDLQPA